MLLERWRFPVARLPLQEVLNHLVLGRYGKGPSTDRSQHLWACVVVRHCYHRLHHPILRVVRDRAQVLRLPRPPRGRLGDVARLRRAVQTSDGVFFRARRCAAPAGRLARAVREVQISDHDPIQEPEAPQSTPSEPALYQHEPVLRMAFRIAGVWLSHHTPCAVGVDVRPTLRVVVGLGESDVRFLPEVLCSFHHAPLPPLVEDWIVCNVHAGTRARPTHATLARYVDFYAGVLGRHDVLHDAQ